jgi:DNA replication protein
MPQPIKSTSQDKSDVQSFRGFPEGKHHQVPLYDIFFKELLPQIDDLTELKVTLYCFWKLDKMEGVFRCVHLNDAIADQDIFLGNDSQASEKISTAFQQAVQRGTLLAAEIQEGDHKEQVFFLNSPRGRAAYQAIQQGTWRPDIMTGRQQKGNLDRPNIFQLYEENIGPLTPIIADSLKDAEETYPGVWVAEAFQIAVEKNKRNWRYISAILERWDREGKYGGTEKPEDRKNTPESRRRYVEGEFSEFIEH